MQALHVWSFNQTAYFSHMRSFNSLKRYGKKKEASCPGDKNKTVTSPQGENV